jgi:hypothetical protein
VSGLLHLVTVPFKWVWGLVSSPGAPSKEKAEKKEATTTSELEDLAEAMKSIRDSLKTMGGAFAAAAGVIVTGLGYAQLHEAFPLPPYGWYRIAAIGGLAVGALLALGGAAWFSGRFFAAQRRIPMQSRIPPREEEVAFSAAAFFSGRYAESRLRRDAALREEKAAGLSDSERSLRRAMFKEDAQAEGAASLYALELRSYRLNRIARRQPEGPARAALEKEAARLEAAIRLTFRRTAAAILERRAQNAYSGWRTRAAILAFIVGVGLLFGTADWAKGERDLIELRAKCAEAEAKGAPDACRPVRDDVSVLRVPTTASQVTTRRLELLRRRSLVSCLEDVIGLRASKEVKVAAISLCAPADSG